MRNNRGVGAGGANTNKYGKQFEELTDNSLNLLNLGFKATPIHQVGSPGSLNIKQKIKQSTCLSWESGQVTVSFVVQHGLKQFMKARYDKHLFRCPDEAYIIYCKATEITTIYILEKKEQHVEGSAETKLWSGPSLKREYQLVLSEDHFVVHYGFCVSDFLKTKLTSTAPKYVCLNKIFAENDIKCLYGNDPDYFTRLHLWWTTPICDTIAAEGR